MKSCANYHKGFISSYFLIVLSFVSSAVLIHQTILQRYLNNLQDIQLLQEQTFIEILLIDKIKSDLYDYEESNADYSTTEWKIRLLYDGSTATMDFQGKSCFRATLIYDDFSYTVEDYYYSEVKSCTNIGSMEPLH